MVGLKMVMYTQISPKIVNPRDTDGNAEEDEEEGTLIIILPGSWPDQQ